MPDKLVLHIKGQKNATDMACHALSATEDCAISGCEEPNLSPEPVIRNKGLNPFMAAKLADAVGQGQYRQV